MNKDDYKPNKKTERHDEIVALLKEIRDAINVFEEFVLEVTPQDAKNDIEKLN